MSRLYCFHGKDVYTIQKETSKLLKSFGNTETTFECSKELDLSAISDILMQFSLFGDCNIVYIKDFNADVLKESQFKSFMSIIGNIPATSKLIITMSNIYSDKKVKGKDVPTAKNKKLLDFVATCGKIQEFDIKRRPELVKMLTGNYKIRPDAAELLCEYCLDDTLMIINEAEKLSTFTKDIDVNTVNLLVSKHLDTVIFKISDAIINFDGGTVFKILDELFEQKHEPVPIWANISSAITDLYLSKIAALNYKQKNEIVNDFKIQQNMAWKFDERNISKTRNINIHKLRYCMRICTETDVMLKSNSIDKRVLMEIALTKMLIF